MEVRSGKSFQMQILLDTPHCRPVCCHWKSRSLQVYLWASTACNQNLGIILVDLRFESVKILVVSKVNIKRVDVCAVITWRKRNCEQTMIIPAFEQARPTGVPISKYMLLTITFSASFLSLKEENWRKRKIILNAGVITTYTHRQNCWKGYLCFLVVFSASSFVSVTR